MDSQFYYKKDKLNQIKGFCMMVQTNSMIEAAKKIGVEPATISKQIKSLERDIGLQLFYQELPKRKLILTEAGKKFYEKAVIILNEFNSLYTHLPLDIKNQTNKVIKIACHHTALNYLLPHYIKNFQNENKDIKFTIYNIKIHEAIEKLLNEDIDFLIHVSDKIPPEIKSITLFDFKPVIMLNKNNPLAIKDSNKITFEDLAKQNMITLDSDNIIYDFVKLCKQNKIDTNINVLNGDWESVKNFVKLDVGIHLYSEIYDKFEEFKDTDIITKSVEHLFPRIRFQLMYKNGILFNKYLQNFFDIIIKSSKLI